ncbi:PDR/VanB family oxidoreductase [Streptomyces rugosispiralis]|uniref:PDR/VanB family oxidoreductase n=1 Tax=Streptomyces rugosispiralis TaxID=2967341 RepID=A0ABT1URW6_9ACTN|nr:PDR/VanB family oxidoreductase [Streptomyces rugosispiralis]MCQ8187872.1 PDR/VanB family oxidoreductase [Streptomyces rugosispiralis]
MHTTHDEVDLRLRVVSRKVGPEGIVVLELADRFGAPLPAWSPGAHIDVLMPGDMVRQYSLCGDPAEGSVWRIAVLREPDGRGGSAFLHDRVRAGDQLEIRGPRNNFQLLPAARYVFIAGGIGVTPLLPMARAAHRGGAEWEFHYGGRSRTSMAFLDDLGALRTGSGQPARVTLYAQDEVGLIDLESILASPRPGTLVYCCGPEPLLEAVERCCARWPSGTLHVERFAPKDAGEPVFSGPFKVALATSGMTLEVPLDKSILDVVREAGVAVPSSCQEGTCGTCETPVLEGTVDHRDSLLSPEERAENDTMFICVSRAACPRLVLDL